MTITTELVLVRHGEAVCNVSGIVGGDVGCTGLTGRGWEQVARLAIRLAEEHAEDPFDVVYASPRRRVRETAQIITDALTLAAVGNAELRGPDHGEADGQRWHDIKTAFGGPPSTILTGLTLPDRNHGTPIWNARPAPWRRSSIGTPDSGSSSSPTARALPHRPIIRPVRGSRPRYAFPVKEEP